MGRLSEGRETLDYIDQQSHKLADIGIRLQKWKLLARGTFQYASGDLLEAEQYHRAQLTAASEGELWLDFTSAARELSLDLISLGRLQEAETILSEAIPVADKYTDWSRVMLRGIQSMVYAKQGKLSLSQNILGEGDSLESQRESVWYKLMLDWARAWVLASTSSYREAFEVFENTCDEMAKIELRTYQLAVVRDWADVYLARGEPGDLDRARELLTEALTEYQNMGAHGWVKLVMARLAELGG